MLEEQVHCILYVVFKKLLELKLVMQVMYIIN